MEVAVMIAAAALVFCGIAAVIWPHSGVVTHFLNNGRGTGPRYSVEVVTDVGARAYGLVALVIGIVLFGMAAYRGKNS